MTGTTEISADSSPNAPGTFLFAIYINAFLVGGVIMAFEMLGSRYLNPYFGSGIYTWAALIATVLLALSLGYFIGGWLADRWPRAGVLGAIIALASVHMLCVPGFAAPLFETVFDMVNDIRYGALVAAIALMVVPVTMFGVYSPYAIRLTLRTTAASGTVAGRIYGVSTLGSIVGTLLTTFVLIPAIGTTAITLWLGVVGLACGLSLMLLPRRRMTAAVAVLALAAMSIPADRAHADDAQRLSLEELRALPDGVVTHIESEYNDIFVRKQNDYLRMSFRRYGKNYVESVRDLTDAGALPVGYTKLMTAALAFGESPASMLMIGVGGGLTSSYLSRHLLDMVADVVELDPGVVRAARRYFDLTESERYRVHVSDGRVYLMRNKTKFDLIMVDAFRGGYVPFHLLTQEFYRLLVRRLSDDGIAAFNLNPGTKLFLSTITTLKSVFPELHAFGNDETSRNVIVVALKKPSGNRDIAEEGAARAQAAHSFRYDLTRLVRQRFDLEAMPEGKLLTDDFAPVNLYEAVDIRNERKTD